MKRVWVRRISVLVVVAALMATSFYVGNRTVDPAARSDQQLKSERATYSLLAPRLFVDSPNDTILSFSGLRSQLEAYTADLSARGISSGIYFEYLPTGTSIDTGDRTSFVAASLMKTPLALNLMKLHEQGKIDIDKKIPLKREWLNDEFGDLYQKGAGYELTLREAVAIMLEKSDNTAALMIQESLSTHPLGQNDDSLYSTDVTIELDTEKRAIVTARSYTSILKCLYFSCFLNKEDSQELLGYLTKTEFGDRLKKNLPAEVPVAHKIGTYSQKTQSDCGIVYATRRNYALCVMLDQPDPEGSATIADISSKVYEYVTKAQTSRN